MDRRLTFGIITDWVDETSSYQKGILEGISSWCRDNDVNLHVLVSGRIKGPSNLEEFKNRILDYINKDNFDGLLIFSSTIGSFIGKEELEKALQSLRDIPTVSIGSTLYNSSSVLVDNNVGFREIINHLLNEHKYKRIAFINGPKNNPDAIQRLNILKEELLKFNLDLPEKNIFFGDFILPSGRDGVNYFISNKIEIDVIICSNDDMAIGAWEALLEKGISVPEEIAITGFDNRQTGILFDLPITTVNQPLFEQGYSASELLFSQVVKGLDNRHKTVLVNSKAVIKESCGCYNKNCQYSELLSIEVLDFLDKKKNLFKSLLENNEISPKNKIKEWRNIVFEITNRKIKLAGILYIIDAIEKEPHTGIQKEIIFEMKVLAEKIYREFSVIDSISQKEKLLQVEFLKEDFSQAVVSKPVFNDEKGYLANLLQTIEVDFFSVSVFTKLSKENTELKTLFSFYKGVPIEIPKKYSFFDPTKIINPFVLPQSRYEVVTSLMYDTSKLIGFINMGLDAIGLDIYERMRSRLSEILYSIEITRELNEEVNARKNAEEKLKIALKELEELSLTDELTGLNNRRGFLTLGEQLLKINIRDKKRTLVFFVDMDGLKGINDNYGHEEGDFAIIEISKILKKSFRGADIIGRLGGDEFAILCELNELYNSNIFINRLEKEISAINTRLNKNYTINMSYGSCEYHPEKASTLNEMILIADEEMYRAKKNKYQNF